MKRMIVENYERMSQAAAIHIAGVLAGGFYRRVNVSLTAGQTPARAYELLHEMIKGIKIPYLHYYNFVTVQDGSSSRPKKRVKKHRRFLRCEYSCKKLLTSKLDAAFCSYIPAVLNSYIILMKYRWKGIRRG